MTYSIVEIHLIGMALAMACHRINVMYCHASDFNRKNWYLAPVFATLWPVTVTASLYGYVREFRNRGRLRAMQQRLIAEYESIMRRGMEQVDSGDVVARIFHAGLHKVTLDIVARFYDDPVGVMKEIEAIKDYVTRMQDRPDSEQPSNTRSPDGDADESGSGQLESSPHSGPSQSASKDCSGTPDRPVSYPQGSGQSSSTSHECRKQAECQRRNCCQAQN